MNTLKITVRHRRQDKACWPVDIEFIRDHELPIRRQAQLRLPENYKTTLLGISINARGQGEFLGQALFVDGAKELFMTARDQAAASEGDVLHVQLTVEAAELQGLRWERLCAPDGQDGWDFLAMDQRAPFSFHLSSSSPRSFPPLGRIDLRALVVVASPPKDNNWKLEWFDANEAADSVRAALDGIPCDLLGSMADAVGPATLEALCYQLTKGQGAAGQPYTLLHVVAHGKVVDGQPQLYLLNKEGGVAAQPANKLVEQLARAKRPHLAFLSACESAKSDGAMGGLARQMVELLGLPAVVAMTEPVSVVTASELAKSFYLRLRDHGLPDLALAEACASLQERHDILTGTLWSRLEGKPLFDDRLDRPLSDAAVENGLDRMEKLLPDWAPILMQEFVEAAKVLRGLPRHSDEALSSTARKERDKALADLDSLCREVLDLSFPALALDASLVGSPPEKPFLGLRAFRNEERQWFFGRESKAKEFCDRLSEHDFLVVLGDSGSGKTSLIQAGMIPLLEERAQEEGGTFHAAVMTPGANPEAALSSQIEQLPQAGSVLLVVDQLEELFVLRADKETQRRFLDRLLALRQERSDLRLLLAIRTGFEDQMDFDADFVRLFEADHELLRPMNASELRSVVEQQSSAAGLRFEPNLADAILDDLEGAAGIMSLLQHLLQELWDRRHGRWLSGKEWEKIGNAAKAFGQSRELQSACNQAQSDGMEEFLRGLLGRLVRLDESKKPNGCRQLPMEDLIPEAEEQAPFRRLTWQMVDERLLVSSADQQTGQPEIRLASDKLIDVWPRLKKWLNEDREVLGLLQEQIRDAAREWRRDGRLDEDLPRKGDQLLQAEGLLRMARFAPNVLEAEFLDAARSLAEKELREKEEKELEIRHNLGLALNEKAAAAEQADKPLRAHLYSLHALNQPLRKDGKAWQQAVRRASTSVARPSFRTPDASLHDAGVTCIAFSPDGALLASGSRDRTIALWDMVTGRKIRRLEGHLNDVTCIAFSPDGAMLASGANDRTIALWEMATGRRIRRLEGHLNDVTCIAFSPDGALLASGSRDRTIAIWDAASGQRRQVLKKPLEQAVAFSPDGQWLVSGSFVSHEVMLWNVAEGIVSEEPLKVLVGSRHENIATSFAFSPDGRTAASGSFDKKILLWDVVSGKHLQTLEGHADKVCSVAFSPDGRMLASGSRDETVMLWHGPQTGNCMHHQTLRGHGESVASVFFSPNGRILASGSEEGMVLLWDSATGRQIQTFEGHWRSVASVAFSPDGRSLATGSGDRTARLWDAATGRQIQAFEGHADSVAGVAFSPDGRTLATGSGDRTARLWDVATGRQIQTFKGHADSVAGVAFSPDGRTLATGSSDTTAALWDVATGQQIQTFKGHWRSVTSAAFSPDGRSLATGSGDRTARLWDVATGQQIQTFEGHAASVARVAFSPDGRTLATGSGDRTARFWDVATGRQIQIFEGHWGNVASVAFSPDGRTLATGSSDTTVALWDVATGRQIQTLEGHADNVASVAFSPDGLILATGSEDGTVVLWDVASESVIQPPERLSSRMVGSMAFSPDGRSLAMNSGNSTVCLWDAATGRQIQTFEGHADNVASVAFSPDGLILATGSSDNTAALWDVATGRRIQTFKGHANKVTSVAFSPDGSMVATGSFDRKAMLWDTASGKMIRPLGDHENIVTSVAFSPDGSLIATGSFDRKAMLWDTASGRCMQTLEWHQDKATSVSFSPDGRTLATSSEDGTVILWDAATGMRIRTIEGHDASVASVAFSPDGRILATGSWDDSAILWDAATGMRIRSIKVHLEGVASVIFSSDGHVLATRGTDGTAALWDLAEDASQWSGLSLDQDEYILELDGLPWELKGLDLIPKDQRNLLHAVSPPAQWSRIHPLHWLARAEAGDAQAMLEIALIHDRSNDIARALRWYQKAMAAGSQRAKEQQDRLLHWLESEENRKTVPAPMLLALCAAREELGLSGSLPFAACERATP